MTDPVLHQAINPQSPENELDDILAGEFYDIHKDLTSLNDTRRTWLNNLSYSVNQEISLSLSIEDFNFLIKTRMCSVFTIWAPSGALQSGPRMPLPRIISSAKPHH